MQINRDVVTISGIEGLYGSDFITPSDRLTMFKDLRKRRIAASKVDFSARGVGVNALNSRLIFNHGLLLETSQNVYLSLSHCTMQNRIDCSSCKQDDML